MAMTSKRRGPDRQGSIRVIQRSKATTGREQPQDRAAPLDPESCLTVIAIHQNGPRDREASAPERVLAFSAPQAPRGSSQILIGWVPGRGDDRNATATDAVEW